MPSQSIISTPADYQRFEQLMREFTKIPSQFPLSLRSYKQLVNESPNVDIPVIIALAIWSSPEKKLTLAQIRAAIAPYFPAVAAKNFRCTLSHKNMFVRLHRGIEHGGRGSLWGVDPSQQGSRKSGQSSSASGSPITEDSMYELVLSTGVSPQILDGRLPSPGGEPHVLRPGDAKRRTPYAPR